MDMVANQEIFVNDLRNVRLSFFDLKGELLREVSRGKYFRMTRIIPDEARNLYGEISMRNENIYSVNLIKFDSHFEEIWNFNLYKEQYTPGRLNLVGPQFLFHTLKNNNIVWIDTSKYEFQIINPNGKLVKKIIKVYKPLEITEKIKDNLIKTWAEGRGGIPSDIKFEFPKYFPPIQHFNTNDENMIIAHTYNVSPTGADYYDFFNEEGKYIVKVALNYIPIVWKQNRIYTIAEDVNGYQYIKRYKVTWNY